MILIRLGGINMQGDVLRLVETIHKNKAIDKEIIFQGIESALQSAARKKYRSSSDVIIHIDRKNGDIIASSKDGDKLEPPEFGRIAAQTAKQLIIQKIREAERDVIHTEFIHKKRSIVTGYVQRYEHKNLIVNLGKTEGVLPPREQILGEYYRPGDRIRAYLLDVKKISHRVKLILSRTHPNFIRKLFELEVPEITQGIIEVLNVVREAGYRTKIAVVSKDDKVDCVGACVGVRGSRIKNIIDELGGEKIDIIPWDSSPEIFIANALKPAEIEKIFLEPDKKKARVVVQDSQQPLAIGKEGQNVRLAAKLCKWDIDIIPQADADTSNNEEYTSEIESEQQEVQQPENQDEE